MLNSGQMRGWKSFLVLNVVLRPLELSVEEEGAAAEEGGAANRQEIFGARLLKGGAWVVRKGAWSQPFEENMKVSAFPSRDWARRVKPALLQLPPLIHTADLQKPAAAAPAGAGVRAGAAGGGAKPSVLGKRPGPPVHFGANKWCVELGWKKAGRQGGVPLLGLSYSSYADPTAFLLSFVDIAPGYGRAEVTMAIKAKQTGEQQQQQQRRGRRRVKRRRRRRVKHTWEVPILN